MKDKKKLTLGILVVSFLTLIIFPLYSVAQTFEHPGDHDEPVLISDNIGQELVWYVENASGVFYDNLVATNPEYQVGSYIKYEVLSLDYDNDLYNVDISAKYYTNNDYVYIGQDTSDFLLVGRDWGESMVRFIVEENDEFWGPQETIDQAYDSSYSTIWWEFNFINTYTVTFKLNETDYEELVYTRAEGILLSRTAVVGGGQGGYLRIELVSFSGSLELSPWFYVIIGASFFGIIVLTLVVGSLESQRKKLMRIREEEIKGRSYIGAVIGFLITVFGLINLVNVTSVQITATETAVFYIIEPLHFIFTFCGILLIALMSLRENTYRGSGLAAGIGVAVFGLVLIIDYFIVYTQVMMTSYTSEDQIYFTILGYIPGWIPLLMFPIGITLLILGLFMCGTLALKEGRDTIFLKSGLPILILVGVFCLVDYAFNIVTLYQVDLTPIDHWSTYVSGFLIIGFIFLIPLVTFLIFTKKR